MDVAALNNFDYLPVDQLAGVYRSRNTLRMEREPDAPAIRLRGRRPQSNEFMRGLLAKPRDRVFEHCATSRDLTQAVGGYLILKAYASDRIVLTSGHRAFPSAKKRVTWRQARAKLALGTRLDERRETRRRWWIGGRLRGLPSQTRFTNWGRNFIRDGAHIVERTERGKGVFLTLTVACDNEKAFECLSAASGYLVDRLNRWLRYKIQGGKYLYVWELQKRGAPHLHYMFRVGRHTDLSRLAGEVQAEWRAILLDVCESAGVDLFEKRDGGTWRDDPRKPFVQAKEVFGSYAQYLSKYLSKTRSKAGGRHRWFPGRWWALSSQLRAEVLRNRLRVCVTFPDSEEAARALTRLVSIGGEILQSVFVCASGEAFGAHTISASVPVGLGVPVVTALAELVTLGDCTDFEAIRRDFQVPVNLR